MTIGTNFVGIDYTPESRCSDDNWSSTSPQQCNPQLSFTCTGGNGLSGCPSRCQSCYTADLTNLQSALKTTTIATYQPNFYILTAADQLKLKVVLGLWNDTIPGLAASDSATNCTFAGQPLAFCGTKYADAMFDGACFNQSPWNPNTFCSAPGAYVEALNSSAGQFLADGTVIAIQIGNEALGTTINGQTVTVQMISMAAQNLRTALNARGFGNIAIVISLKESQEQTFCSGGAPPAGVDLVASHPYCDSVASVPPSWRLDGAACWSQVQSLFAMNGQKYCGASAYIGETGYNTGCPNNPSVPPTTLTDEQTFIQSVVQSTCQQSPPGPPVFLFAYSDVCPAGGCLAGCSGAPAEGNGYWGVFHTENYLTEGAPVAKFTPVPSLTCP